MIITEQEHHNDFTQIFDMNLLHGIQKKGIIHIGAHQGQEVEHYLYLGFENILLIEANPTWYQYLKNEFNDVPQVRIYNYAACDFNGFVSFHIHTSRSGSTEPASIFPMKKFKEIVPTLHTPETIEVEAITLDHLLAKHHISPLDYNFVNLDIQGAELLALQGAQQLLEHADVIISEVNLIDMYENGPTEKSIIEFLQKRGFEKQKGVYHTLYQGDTTIPAWGECLFIKQPLMDQE